MQKHLQTNTKLSAGRKLFLLLFIAAIGLIFTQNAQAQGCKALYSFKPDGLTVRFFDSSTAQNSLRYFWEFGDGTKSDAKNPVHKYSTYGSYRACLKIIDTTAKCTATFCETVKLIAPSCNANFTYTLSGKNIKLYADTVNNKSTAKFSWKLGDGNFRTGATVLYSYATEDTFEVCLTVSDSPCLQKSCKAIIVGGSGTTNKYRISGKVDAGGQPAYPGRVLLIIFNEKDSTLKAIADTKIVKDSLGARYLFENVVPGTYYTKAILDTSSTDYKNYLPTYWESSIKWAKANKIVVSTSNVINKNIHLQKGTNPGGKGFIGGRISQGANKAAGDPISDIQVMLLDVTDNPVAYTFSDLQGNYSFSDLAYGTYQVYAEVLGLPTKPAWITISETKPEEKMVEITVNSKEVTTTVLTKVNEIETPQTLSTSVYPNPVKDFLNLTINSASAYQATLQLYDVTGKILQAQNLKVIAGKQNVQLNTEQLTNGIYFVKMQLSNGDEIQHKFIK